MSRETQMPERRFYSIEAKAAAETDKKRISGAGAVFGQYANMGWYVELIEPAFLNDANTEQCACLFNHDINLVLGRMKSGTMGIDISEKILGYWAYPPETRNDVYELIDRGDIYQSSFAFATKKARWEQLTPDDLKGIFEDWEIEKLTYGGVIDLRILESANVLYDVSPVTYPAYQQTTVDAKYSEILKEERSTFRKSSKIFSADTESRSDDWLNYINAAKQALD